MTRQHARNSGDGGGGPSGGGRNKSDPGFQSWWNEFAKLPKEDRQLIVSNRDRWPEGYQLLDPAHMVAFLREEEQHKEERAEQYGVAPPWEMLVEQDVDAQTITSWEYSDEDEAYQYADMYDGGRKGVLFGNKPPEVTDVRQGINDCWFVGTLCALVLSDPDYITDELLEQAGDTVTVHLHWKQGGKIQPAPKQVSLSSMLARVDWEEPEQAMAYAYPQDGKNVLWVAAVEHAMAQLMQEHEVGGSGKDGWRRMHGNSTRLAMLVLTGKGAEWAFADEEGFDHTRADEGGDPVYSDLELAAKLDRAINVDHTPTTGVMDGHVVPITAVFGGPTADQFAELRQAKKAPDHAEYDTLSTELAPLLESFSVDYYNQNLDRETNESSEYQTVYTGMTAIKDKFVHGFCFGRRP